MCCDKDGFTKLFAATEVARKDPSPGQEAASGDPAFLAGGIVQTEKDFHKSQIADCISTTDSRETLWRDRDRFYSTGEKIWPHGIGRAWKVNQYSEREHLVSGKLRGCI